MSQYTIDKEFLTGLAGTKAIVEEYLSKCHTCRNDDQHLIKHIWHRKSYAWVTTENVRRMRQIIQNDEGRYVADIETQQGRAAKQQFMEHNIHKLKQVQVTI